MRGKDDTLPTLSAEWRITPAYAGKSGLFCAADQEGWDHPRICGEKRFKRDQDIKLTGSPPHMRGKGYDLVPTIQKYGITPAYAGKSYLFCA